MKQVIEEKDENLEEVNNLRYSTVTEYSPRLIRYALQLRYTSLQRYKLLLEELPLPSVSFLKKLTSGVLKLLTKFSFARSELFIN